MILPLSRTKTRVVCFGNRLHGDDAIGCLVYDALTQAAVPQNVSVYDGGTAGLNALLFFEECESVILVDALAPRERPGKVWSLSQQDVLDSEGASLTSHGLGLGYLLQTVACTLPPAAQPKVTVFGIEVADVTAFSNRVSAEVLAAVPVVVSRIAQTAEWKH